MDVAGLVVGLSGLVAVFETSCKVWRTIRAASGFGDDVADSIRKLEMEFFRFYTWWDVLRSLELQKVSPFRFMKFASCRKWEYALGSPVKSRLLYKVTRPQGCRGGPK